MLKNLSPQRILQKTVPGALQDPGTVGRTGVPPQDTPSAKPPAPAAQYQAVGATGMADPSTQLPDVGLTQATEALANASVSNGLLNVSTSAHSISAEKAHALLGGDLRDLGVLETQVVSDPNVGSYLLSWVPDSRTMDRVEDFLRQTEQDLDFPYDVQVYHAPGAASTELQQLNAAEAVVQMTETLQRYGATTITVEQDPAAGQYMMVRAPDQKSLDSLVAILEALEKKVDFPWDAALDSQAKAARPTADTSKAAPSLSVIEEIQARLNALAPQTTDAATTQSVPAASATISPQDTTVSTATPAAAPVSEREMTAAAYSLFKQIAQNDIDPIKMGVKITVGEDRSNPWIRIEPNLGPHMRRAPMVTCAVQAQYLGNNRMMIQPTGLPGHMLDVKAVRDREGQLVLRAASFPQNDVLLDIIDSAR